MLPSAIVFCVVQFEKGLLPASVVALYYSLKTPTFFRSLSGVSELSLPIVRSRSKQNGK